MCLSAPGPGRVADDGPVGNGGVVLIDDEGDIEGGLEGGLIEGGESTARIGGLELGDGVVPAGGFREVEATQLAIQDSGVLDGDLGFPGGKLVWNGESGLLLLFVE